MDESFDSIIEKHSQAILNQLKDNFINEGDFELHYILPTSNYRSDSIICTDLIIGKIIQTLSDNTYSEIYILMMTLNLIFSTHKKTRDIYRKNILTSIGIHQNSYTSPNINDLIYSIEKEINLGNICFIEANTTSLPYNLLYKSKNVGQLSHEIIINGYNEQKKCLIGYDNSFSYSLRLFDEISNISQFFRLYYDEDLIAKICKKKNDCYHFTSFMKENSDIPNPNLLLKQLLKECLKLESNSHFSLIIQNIVNDTDYTIDFLKMVSIGSYKILFYEIEKHFSISSDVEFINYKNNAINFRNKAFNKILKYKFIDNKKKPLLKNNLLELSYDVSKKDLELQKKILEIIK